MPASTYSSATHNTTSVGAIYCGIMFNGTLYGSVSGTSTNAYNLYNTSFTAGEAVVSPDIIYLNSDNKWYKACANGKQIPLGAILARCASSYSAGATVGAYIQGYLPFSSALPGSRVLGKDMFLRGQVSDGLFISDGNLTTELAPGYSYMRIGENIGATDYVFYDGNNRVYEIDSNGHVEALDGFTFNATTLNGKADTYFEPAFSKNSAFNKNFGAAAGTVSEGNHLHDARYSQLGHDHSGMYEPIIMTKGSAFNKNFGSGTDTVCQGNDSRLSDARTPLSHSHAITDLPTGTAANQLALGNHIHSGYEPSFTKNSAFNKDFVDTSMGSYSKPVSNSVPSEGHYFGSSDMVARVDHSHAIGDHTHTGYLAAPVKTTYTPSVTIIAGPSVTIISRSAWDIVIGDMVYVEIYIQLKTSTTSSGFAIQTRLRLTPADNTDFEVSIPVEANAFSFAVTNTPVRAAGSSGSLDITTQYGSPSGPVSFAIKSSYTNINGSIRIKGWYRKA